MKGDAYSEALHGAHVVRILARILDGRCDLAGAVRAVDEADAVGAILDPTLYRDRAGAMQEDRATLVAVRDLARMHRAAAVAGGPQRNGTAASGGGNLG